MQPATPWDRALSGGGTDDYNAPPIFRTRGIMGIRVCKFGGSSVADAGQLRKVRAIVEGRDDRRFVDRKSTRLNSSH